MESAADSAPYVSRERQDVLLVEYQKSQDSAEHHDLLVSNVTSLNWIGSAVLMGFVLGGVASHPHGSYKAALLSVAVVGMLLAGLVWLWVRQLRRVKVVKYNRCKEIEEKLGMTQHSSLEYPSGSQTKAYAVLMVTFLVVWLVLIVLVAAA